MRLLRFAVLSLLTYLVAAPLQAQATPRLTPQWRNFEWRFPLPFPAQYSRRGLELGTREGAYTARIQWRLQLRFATPADSDPRTPAQFAARDTNRLRLRRSRFRMEGNAFSRRISYVIQHDFLTHAWIDYYADVRLRPWLQIRAGQWRSIYSQERYMGSGRQGPVDVSIVSREFSLDRQIGMEASGQVLRGSGLYSVALLERHRPEHRLRRIADGDGALSMEPVAAGSGGRGR